MPTSWKADRFDVVEYARSSVVLAGLLPSIDALALERREEAFDRGVLPAITLVAHAASHALSRKQSLEILARALAARARLVLRLTRIARRQIANIGAPAHRTRALEERAASLWCAATGGFDE
jgi:hypothetical protein